MLILMITGTCCFTRAFFGTLNFFGGPSETSIRTNTKLRQIEQENEDAMFIFLSDVWLDDVKVNETQIIL